jgi:superfamily I DNA and RNA helicase
MEPQDIVILVAGYTKEAYYEAIRSRTLPKGIKYSIEAHRVPNSVLVDTVGRFKGLESNILILWGLDEFDPNQDKEVLYVAFSRAKSRLHLFGTQVACRRTLETRF